MTRISAIKKQRDAGIRVLRRALRALGRARKDSERLDWLLSHHMPLLLSRREIDAAMRADSAGRKS